MKRVLHDRLVLLVATAVSATFAFASEKSPAPRIFPFAMEGANLPNVWNMTGNREPAGSGGFLTAKGADFVDATGRKRRFFGVNLYGPASLPEKTDAPAMAERIARWGVNAVRVLPQYIWQLRTDRDYSKGIDPGLLDRFDWLFFQLKERGISVDMNLHSARTAGYRFKDFRQTMKENKGLDNFDPTFILHQKEFIREIFNHVNPYTGLAYRDDPAVMAWEINNECSLVGSWFTMNMEDRLTPHFRRELERQFCEWLRAKYGTTARLREAWTVSSPMEPDVISSEAWKDQAAFRRMRWYTEGRGRKVSLSDYTLDAEKGIVRIDAASIRKFAVAGVPLKAEYPYTVSLRIRSEKQGEVSLKVCQHGQPWGDQGCSRSYSTGADWLEVKVRSEALVSDEDNRVQIQFNRQGVYEIAGFSFVRGGEIGLDPGESIEDGTVGLGTRRTSARKRDLVEFILDTEDRYWKEMYGFVKDEMAARAPVNCGTARYGALYPQAYGDFTDEHYYFGSFPVFPDNVWNLSNWYANNRSMVRSIGDRAWGRAPQLIFESRVFGKPFTVSEANVHAVYTTAAEFFPVMLSLAAFQDAAAVHGYAWSHAGDHSYGGRQFFDMRGNAKLLAHLPASVNMFVRGDVRSGASERARIAYKLGRRDEREKIITTGYSGAAATGETDMHACLKAVTGLVLTDLPQKSAVETTPYAGTDDKERATVSSTGEIRWDATKTGEERYVVDTPRTKFISAFGKAGTSQTFADGFTVTLGDTLMGWAAISFTELSPGRCLLAATGYQQPSDAKLTHAETGKQISPEEGVKALGERITTAKAMGTLPYVCEGVRATIRTPSADALRVTPIDGDARPLSAPFVAKSLGGFATFDISERYRTVWYLVEKLSGCRIEGEKSSRTENDRI